MTIYTPYTYFIHRSTQNISYYGVRFATKSNCLYESGCHPDDFWVTYFTSSKIVKDHIQKHGQPDITQIDKTFTNNNDARNYEHSVLTFLDVRNNKLWLNKSTGKCLETSGPKSEEHKRKISISQLGVKRGPPTDEHRQKISRANKGKKVSRTKERQEKLEAAWALQKGDDYRRKASEIGKGKPKPRVLCQFCGSVTTPVALSRFHSHERCPS